jgi:hypothetical protein
MASTTNREAGMPVTSGAARHPNVLVAVAGLGGLMLAAKVVATVISGVISIARNEAELRGVDAVAVLDLGGWGRRKA